MHGPPTWSLWDVATFSATAFYKGGRALTHRVIMRYGNAASPHASRSPWKHSCVLRLPATSILIQERCFSFENMVLGRSHYRYESQCSKHCTAINWQRTVAAGCTNSSNSPLSILVVPWLLYSPLDPGRGRCIFQSVKIPSKTSFGRGIKPWVPCGLFTARTVKEPHAEIRASGQNLSDSSRSL